MSARVRFVAENLWDALLDSSPLIPRALLAFAMLTCGIALLLGAGDWDRMLTLTSHRAVASRTAWGAMYALAGVAQLWRLLDLVPRIFVSSVINSLSAALVTITVSISAWDGWPFWPLGAYIAALSIWVALRTAFTRLDRVRA